MAFRREELAGEIREPLFPRRLLLEGLAAMEGAPPPAPPPTLEGDEERKMVLLVGSSPTALCPNKTEYRPSCFLLVLLMLLEGEGVIADGLMGEEPAKASCVGRACRSLAEAAAEASLAPRGGAGGVEERS